MNNSLKRKISLEWHENYVYNIRMLTKAACYKISWREAEEKQQILISIYLIYISETSVSLLILRNQS